MTGRRHLGLVAAAATLLATAPLATVYERWVWLVECVVVVAAVAAAAAAARSLRAPVWAQALAMLGALTVALTWLHPSGGEPLGILPSPATFGNFNELLDQSGQDMRDYGVPVPDREALLFVTALGMGLVAVVVDLCAVGLRRPALAGLPMLAIYSVPVAVRYDSVPVVPFLIGTAGYLWLLMADGVDRVRRFGRRFTGDGRDIDLWAPSPLAAAGRRLAALGVLVAVSAPLVVPLPTAGLLDQFGTGLGGSGSGRGGAGTVNLLAALSGSLNQDTTEEWIRLRTTEGQPYYLRFGVSDVITEEGFTNRGPAGRPVTRDLPEPAAPAVDGVTQERHTASIKITDAFNMPMVPTYPGLAEISGLDATWFYDPDMAIVFSERSRSRGQRYTFEYVSTRYSAEALRTAEPLAAGHPIQAFTEVPRIRQVSDLVERLTGRARTPYDRARAIYNYFSRSNGFRYSLQVEPATSGNAILDFLGNKAGFCVQYAAALAWLARTAGLPARVAIGFTRGDNPGDGHTYVLTNRNAHAWTEIYFNGFGWVPFDATPSSSITGSVDPQWAPNPDAPPGTDPVPRTSPGDQRRDQAGATPTEIPGLPRDEVGDVPDGSRPASSSWPWWALGATLLLLALLAVPAVARIRLRRRRTATRHTVPDAPVAGRAGAPPVGVVTGDDEAAARHRAHTAWGELLDTMIDFRVPVDPAETPRATAERLATRYLPGRPAGDGRPGAPVQDEVRLLGRAEERARYAPTPLATGGLPQALREVRRALAGQATRRSRLRAALLPPSTLLRWRLAVAEGGTRAAAVLARIGDAAARLSPRRLLTR